MRPFEGIRVIDFTQVIAGPYCTFQLAALGADVVKLEQPGVGDQGRRLMAPTPQARDAGMSALFSAVNSGKRSLTLDLKNPGARAVVERLVAEADVVVENYKAGTMERLGLGPKVLMAANPKLIYCAISGYGQDGPRAGAAAYDPVVQAASGMMSVTGYESTGPTKVGFWVVDMTTGMNAAFAISSALYRRQQTGAGEIIDVAMLDTAVSLMSPLIGLFLNYGIEPGFTGNGVPGAGGSSTVYPTKDGHVTVAAATDRQFAAMMTEIGRPDMATDPRFSTREARLESGDTYRAAVIEAMSADTAEHWEARLAAVGVPAGRNQRISQLPDDAQLRHRRVFAELPPAPGLEAPFQAVNVGFKLAADGPALSRSPPAVGEHSDEVLSEIGYSIEEIQALRTNGLI
jgi:crotonobetainyl-CoA:carnitine CoA-transferase CaiB-like acyl-CoA transferase